MHIAQLFRYPLKSAQTIHESTLAIREDGPELDRRYMVVTPHHGGWRFVSQRDGFGRALSQVRCEVRADHVLFEHVDRGFVHAPREVPDGPRLTVELHKRGVEVIRLDPSLDAWASELIGREAKLVAAPNKPLRRLPTTTLPDPPHVGLSDGASLLMVTTATVREIANRSGLDEREVIRRLRPNIVADNDGDERHGSPFAEDFWATCRVGDVDLLGYKPCSRCSTICLDEHGLLEANTSSGNLLALLSKSDREKRGPFANMDMPQAGIFIGMNFATRSLGTLRVGDPWRVLTQQNPWRLAV